MRFLPYDEGDDDLHRHHQDYMAVSEPVVTAKKDSQTGSNDKKKTNQNTREKSEIN